MSNPLSSEGQLLRPGIQKSPSQKKRFITSKKRRFKASKIRESFSPSVAFMEQGQDGNSLSPDGKKRKNRTYLVTIIGEGLGNSKDKNYYSGEALTSGAQLFNGSKAYADHPDAISEKTLPERSMKDLVGWYSNCQASKGQDGKVVLRGKLHFFPTAKWLTDMIDTILTDPSTKGAQSQPLFGISINAIGKTRPATMNGEQVNYVESFQRVDSADVVTEPAARGKFEKILESRSGVRGRSSARVTSHMSKRMREAGPALSPKVVKKLADECTAAAMSDDPDEMKQALLDVQKELYPLSSVSGKGPGQPNEEQYSNVNPAGGSEMARPNGTKVKASGKRLVRRKKRFINEAAGTGEDNVDLGEPEPSDIEQNLEGRRGTREADVEDEENDTDLGEFDDFGDSSKRTMSKASEAGLNRRRRMARSAPVEEGMEDMEGLEGEEDMEGMEGLEGEEGEEDGNSTSMGDAGGTSMPAPSSAGPGSSRMVTAKGQGGGMDQDGDGSDDNMDGMGDGDNDGMDDDLGESFESEEGFEDESMESAPRPAMRGRQQFRGGQEAGRRMRRRSTREAKDDVSSGGTTGAYGKSGSAAMPSHADAADDFEEDYTLGKKDTSTSGTGKSYKLKTSVGRANKPVHPRLARKLVHEANRRIEFLEGRVRKLRESNQRRESIIGRYQGIISFHNSKVSAKRLLESAVEKEWLPEGYARTIAPKLYGLSEKAQVREIKYHARLIESTREAVSDGSGERLMESVEGMGARGGSVSRMGSSEGVTSELAESMAQDGIPFVDSNE